MANVLRQKSGAQRLEIVNWLFGASCRLIETNIRSTHANCEDDRIAREVAARIAGGTHWSPYSAPRHESDFTAQDHSLSTILGVAPRFNDRRTPLARAAEHNHHYDETTQIMQQLVYLLKKSSLGLIDQCRLT